MGLISRLRRITLGRIEAFLEAVEASELVLPQLQKELAQEVDRAANAEAKALTAVRAQQRRLDELTGKAARLHQAAELAMQRGQQDLARRALAAEVETQRSAQSASQALSAAQDAYTQAGAVRAQLATALAQLKDKAREILRRRQVAKAQRQVMATLKLPRAPPGASSTRWRGCRRGSIRTRTTFRPARKWPRCSTRSPSSDQLMNSWPTRRFSAGWTISTGSWLTADDQARVSEVGGSLSIEWGRIAFFSCGNTI